MDISDLMYIESVAASARIDDIVKRRQLLEANKEHAVVVNQIIYEKGEFIDKKSAGIEE